MLNRRKGPAMHSPRAQADKKAYQQEVKRIVEDKPNLSLRQEVVEDLVVQGQALEARGSASSLRIAGVRVRGDAVYRAPAVVLTTGTFLQALMHTGEAKTAGGRAGEGTTAGISGALARLGFRLERFKTGTPPRLNGRTIDYARTELQPGDDDAAAVFVPDRRTRRRAAPLLDHVHQRGGARADPRESAPGPDVQRPDRSRAGRGTARRSKTRSSASPTRSSISSSSSPRAATRTRSTSTASRPACRATCRTPCSG